MVLHPAGFPLAGALLTVLATALPAQHRTATGASADPALSALPTAPFLRLPGIVDDLVLDGGGQFTELPNGSAWLHARLVSATAANHVFLLDLQLGGRIDPGQPAHPPAGSPVLQLLPQAYLPVGPVDPAQFRYYTTGSGGLIGLDGYAGGRIALSLGASAVQVGAGANQRNGLLGLDAAFAVQILQQPLFPWTSSGDATLALDLTERALAATHVMVDPAVATGAEFALDLPGVAGDYLFVPAGALTERSDGTLLLQGTLARLLQLDDGWDVSLTLGGRVDPGEAGHPPAGAPVLGLLPGAYAAMGGPIEPGRWHHYTTANGTLHGRGANAGGVIQLGTQGPLQAGFGANQANLHYGLWGTLAANVQTQPTGRTLQLSGNATLALSIATVPLLPAPVLTVPASPPSLPTLTEQGFVLQGSNLAWVEQVAIGPHIVAPGDARRWRAGWFRLLDAQTLEVHPRQGEAPGLVPLSALDRRTRSNQIQVQFTAPVVPTLLTEPVLDVTDPRQHVLVHSGPVSGPTLSAIGLSPDRLPTVIPGIATLGIGLQFFSLTVVEGAFAHDPATGIATLAIANIPPAIRGIQLHWQAVVVDLNAFATPLPTTTIATTSYLP